MFRHSINGGWTDAHNKAAPKGHVCTVRCIDCGGSSFSDDGRFINEFSCKDCIESYIEVYFYKDSYVYA